MDVLFVAPALRGGGAERVLVTLANKLCELGGKVIFLLTISNTIEYKLHPEIKVIVNEGNTSMFGQIRFLRCQLRKHRAYTAISFFTFQNMYLLAAKTGIGIKTIVSERNDPSKTLYRKKWMKNIRKLLYWTADALVFQTADAKAFFPKYISRKGVIIGNPLREELPDPYTGERRHKLVAVSRLNTQKNLPMMLVAFKKVLEYDGRYCLDIYGDGGELDHLMQLCLELDIQDHVCFKGFCENVLDEIRDASAFLSSSDYEGISNSMLEAMAIGLPCICTDCPCGGTRTYIKNMENGMLVSTGSDSEMADAIIKVISDKDLSDNISHNAVKIRAELSVDRIVEQWTKII